MKDTNNWVFKMIKYISKSITSKQDRLNNNEGVYYSWVWTVTEFPVQELIIALYYIAFLVLPTFINTIYAAHRTRHLIDILLFTYSASLLEIFLFV